MDNNVIFATQIATFVGYVSLALVLYKLLVSAKDAEIASLKTQLGFLQLRLDAAAENSFELVSDRMKKQVEILKVQLVEMNEEKGKAVAEAEGLRMKLAGRESIPNRDELVGRLKVADDYIAQVQSEAVWIGQQLRLIDESPMMKFLFLANAELSPGRKQILGEAVKHIGVDEVLKAEPIQLINIWDAAVAEAKGVTNAPPPVFGNGGALTGLRSVGVVDDRDRLTIVGVSEMKKLARVMKSSLTPGSEHVFNLA